MDYKITLLPGDGIGQTVIDAAATVLGAVERKFSHDFRLHTMPIGGAAIDLTGIPLPEETLNECKQSDAVLFGAVGGKKWSGLKAYARPERALDALKIGLGLTVGITPVVSVGNRGKNVNAIFVHGLTGTSSPEQGYRDGANGHEAFDALTLSVNVAERIARVAFEVASARNKLVTSVHNKDLAIGKLWQATVEKVAKGYPYIELETLTQEDCAAKLMRAPYEFDTIVTDGRLYKTLAYVAAGAVGEVGSAPSCAIGGDKAGLFMPLSDSPNALGAISAACVMLSIALHLEREANAVYSAVRKVTAKDKHGKKSNDPKALAEEIALAVLNG